MSIVFQIEYPLRIFFSLWVTRGLSLSEWNCKTMFKTSKFAAKPGGNSIFFTRQLFADVISEHNKNMKLARANDCLHEFTRYVVTEILAIPYIIWLSKLCSISDLDRIIMKNCTLLSVIYPLSNTEAYYSDQFWTYLHIQCLKCKTGVIGLALNSACFN